MSDASKSQEFTNGYTGRRRMQMPHHLSERAHDREIGTLPFYTAAGYKKLALPNEPASRKTSMTLAQFEAASERVEQIMKKEGESTLLAIALRTINEISEMSGRKTQKSEVRSRKSDIKKHGDK